MNRAEEYARRLFPDDYQSDYRTGVVIALTTPLPEGERRRLEAYVTNAITGRILARWEDDPDMITLVASDATDALLEYWSEETTVNETRPHWRTAMGDSDLPPFLTAVEHVAQGLLERREHRGDGLDRLREAHHILENMGDTDPAEGMTDGIRETMAETMRDAHGPFRRFGDAVLRCDVRAADRALMELIEGFQ